jgi:ERCC4-type nuclease
MTVAVVVDDREPPGLAAALRAHSDVTDVTVRRLDAGDVAVGGVGFERKTPADYLGSALGKAGTDLEGQVAAMTAAYDHAYVLVEGDLADVEAARPGVADASVRGSMASITARFGVPVVPCGDRERLADLIVRLASKHAEEPGRRPLSPSAVASRREPIAKRMYGCIEGIGPGTAETLYEVYPTVEALLGATVDDLLAIEGIGPTRAEAIYEAVRSSD